MKLNEALKRLEKAIVCERCHISGKECKEDCPTQYEAGTVGELMEALETVLDYCIVELKGKNNTSEQVEKKCETCKYWDGGYVTFACCECKDKSEWREQTSKTTIKTSDGKEYDVENDCLIRKSEAIKQIYEKSLRIDNPDTRNGLAGAVAILFEMKGE